MERQYLEIKLERQRRIAEGLEEWCTEAQSEALRKYFFCVEDLRSDVSHIEVEAQQKHFVDKINESTSWLQVAIEECTKERDRHGRSFDPNYREKYPNLFLKRTERKTCHEKIILPQELYNQVGGSYHIINGAAAVRGITARF